MPRNDLELWLKKAEALYADIKQQEKQTKNSNSKIFYATFAQSIETGLRETKQALRNNGAASPQRKTKQLTEQSADSGPKANDAGKLLTELKREYITLMDSQHESKEAKGLKDSKANEADRLDSFLNSFNHWLKHRYALEYSVKVLRENLDPDSGPVIKEPLPLQFRLEQNTPSNTFRLIKASSRKPVSEDVSVLDIIDGCYNIPVYAKEGKLLIDDSEVIRFVRLHSEADKLLFFKSDRLSYVASQMYEILIETIKEIKRLSREVIDLINQTPIMDMESAFSNINPDECRQLLRLKFQSLLPGINEDRYRADKKQDTAEKSTRTLETMEDYDRIFQKAKKEVFGSAGSTLAMFYWTRKMLSAVIQNNRALERKDKGSEEKGGDKTGTGKNSHSFNRQIIVGTSITIGEEDIGHFYISPDDIISSEVSIQRADRADKWIAVQKSEKSHRLFRKDFFAVINHFINTDLNKALEKYGFRPIDLQNQLLPEIGERLDDVARIELIRSGILGTTITNLEEFSGNTDFHDTLRRYFLKPNYDNIHYPSSEKMSAVCKGLMNSNTSIMQMKYRRVLKVREEIEQKLKVQKANTCMGTQFDQKDDTINSYDYTKQLWHIIKKIQQIMIHSKPSLADIKLEQDKDVIIIKSTETIDTFTKYKK